MKTDKHINFYYLVAKKVEKTIGKQFLPKYGTFNCFKDWFVYVIYSREKQEAEFIVVIV